MCDSVYRALIVGLFTLLPIFAKADEIVVVSGQAYLQTIDQGPMKLAAMKVYAIPLAALSKFDDVDAEITLPTPLAKTVTDVDGKFTLKIPTDQPFFIFAMGGYTTHRGRYITFEWHIAQADISDPSSLQLQNTNSDPPQHKVSIEGEEAAN
jgi:hypothetical protein